MDIKTWKKITSNVIVHIVRETTMASYLMTFNITVLQLLFEFIKYLTTKFINIRLYNKMKIIVVYTFCVL